MATELDMEKLIQAVRSRPPLWDKHNPMYRKLDLTHNIWNSVIDEMGSNLTVPELKKKWYSLRDCFHRELRIARAGRKKKKWTYYNQMLFLLSAKYNKKSIKNNQKTPCSVKMETPDEMDLNNTDSDHSEFNENENINYDNVMQDVFSQEHGHNETVDDVTVTPNAQETGEHSRFCKIDTENEDPKPRTSAEELGGHCRVPDDNDDYHFAMSLIPYMRQVPMHKKLKMRIKIFKIIAEETGFEDAS